MKLIEYRRSRGFTLIELLVVISIIVMLSLAIMTFLASARSEARDMLRTQNVEQLKLGIRLYKEANMSYPNYPNGATIGRGGVFDTALKPFLPQIEADPLGRPGYNYYYDSNFNCTEAGQAVVYAYQMENEKFVNYDSVCTSAPGALSSAYIMVIK